MSNTTVEAGSAEHIIQLAKDQKFETIEKIVDGSATGTTTLSPEGLQIAIKILEIRDKN